MKKVSDKLFTNIQIVKLKGIKPGGIVHDQGLLQEFAKQGLVKLHEHTGKVVISAFDIPVIASYIESAETFEIEGIGTFREKYVDGCFNPYLIRAELDDKGRVRYY